MVNRVALVGGVCLLVPLAVGCPGSPPAPSGPPAAPAPDNAKAPEIGWARSVAEDFMKAVQHNDGKSAYGLLSPDYRQRVSEGERKQGSFEFPNGLTNDREIVSWNLANEELAPDKGEVRFTGEVKSRLYGAASKDLPDDVYVLTIRVTKGKDSDLWRVSELQVGKKK